MKIIKKYLPDVLIITGIAFTMYWFLEPATKVGGPPRPPSLASTDYHTDLKIVGLVILMVGIDIVVRRIYGVVRASTQRS